MKMNKRDILYLILIIFPYMVMAYFIMIMPEQVPVSLFDKELRLRSKYDLILISGIIGIIEIIFYFYMIYTRIKSHQNDIENRPQTVSENSKRNANILLMSFLIMMSIMNCVSIYLTYQIAVGNQINVIDWISSVSCICLGILLMVNGNVQPRMYEYKDPIEKKWESMSSKNLRQINHFTGVCVFVCGLVIVVLGIVIRGAMPFVIALVLMLVTAILCTIYSYIIYLKDRKESLYRRENNHGKFES